jgi:hypothetical protein
MWRSDLVGKLCNVEDLTYLPPTNVKDLHLEALGCDAGTILVREEYLSTVRELESHRLNTGGMVVTGQPGTGMSLDMGHLSHILITCRKICFFILSARPSP